MSVAISFTLLGDEVFADDIEQMGRRAGNMSPVLSKIKDQWIDWVEEQFATEGKRSGHPWAQLQRDTVFRRGSAHPILVRSADLLLEATDDNNYVVNDANIFLFARDEVSRYGEFHQSGFTSRAGNPVPARPPFDFTIADKEWMYENIQDFIVFGRIP